MRSPAASEPFYYQGFLHYLTPIVDLETSRVFGYQLVCPKCGAKSFINTGIGRTPEHTVEHDAEGKVVVVPPISCPQSACTFRVVIRSGVAYDQRERRRDE